VIIEVVNFTQKTETKKMEKKAGLIPEVNIGLVGHVDHGKTSLTQALTGKWTDTHSEEKKRGITIRLGYADATFYKCNKCNTYNVSSKCASCFENAVPIRAVSFLDAPGHETLMATVLSGASLMDGAVLVISADEECPQPQTAEHLKALDVIGIRNIIIVQNKIDIVSDEQAKKHYRQIKDFVKGTVAENAPIVPISAIHNANVDLLIETIEKIIPTPKRDLSKKPKFYAARSFDVNKPGTKIKELAGGVIGGSVTQGILKKGETIEIRPGAKINDKWTPLTGSVLAIIRTEEVAEAQPGGLVALQTDLDPALTRGDVLAGSIVGSPGELPSVHEAMTMKIELFDHVVGTEGKKIQGLKVGDPLLLTVAIAKTVGAVTSVKKGVADVKLKIPVCADRGDKVAIAMQVSGRWHLVGYGIIQ